MATTATTVWIIVSLRRKSTSVNEKTSLIYIKDSLEFWTTNLLSPFYLITRLSCWKLQQRSTNSWNVENSGVRVSRRECKNCVHVCCVAYRAHEKLIAKSSYALLCPSTVSAISPNCAVCFLMIFMSWKALRRNLSSIKVVTTNITEKVLNVEGPDCGL